MNKMFSVSSNCIECWNSQLDSKIKEELNSADFSECYQTDAVHLYKLENDKFLVVTERGCSCYSYDDADLEVFDTLEEATQWYEKYLK